MGLVKNGQFGNLIILYLLFNLHNILVANESSVSGKCRGEEVNVKHLGLRVQFVVISKSRKSN